jgi:hypothetical protein
MFRRALAFMLTAVILGAPVATAVCQAACAATNGGHAAAEHHSCHGDAAPAGTALSAPAHPCGHTDQLPAGRDLAREELASPPAIVPVATLFVVGLDPTRPEITRVEYRPPLFAALAAPLRL